MLRRCTRGLVVTAAVVVALAGAGAVLAASSSTVTVKRCGYGPAWTFGRAAIYPWHLSCRAAKMVLAANDSHPKAIGFTADGANTGDSQAELIGGVWWVCGGRMGSYFCGYPYRPARVGGVGGGTTFRGRFTEAFAFNACKMLRTGCRARGSVWLPGSAPL